MKMGSALALASVMGLSGAASATTVMTLTYGDLSGNYNGTAAGGTFNAHAVSNPVGTGLRSAGDVARVIPNTGTADFQPGFFGAGSQANFVLNMTLGAISGGQRSGNGSFTSTDANGDTISGNLNGSWQLSGVYLAFVGVLSNVVVSNPSADGTFDGSNTGSFAIGDFLNQLFDGAIVQLTSNTTGGFFASNFADAATGVNAQIQTVPLPPAAWAGLATLAGVVAVRRLRRR